MSLVERMPYVAAKTYVDKSRVAPPLVAALCQIVAHGRLNRYRTGYGPSKTRPALVTHQQVETLMRFGLVRVGAARLEKDAEGYVVPTELGKQWILSGGAIGKDTCGSA